MRRYIKSLDGIRGFGIFFVLSYHFLRLNDSNSSVLGFSWIWIQMFFVQSGFLITDILLRSKNQPFVQYAGEFYWRRMLRIFPLYFAYVLVFAVAYFIFNKPDDFGDKAPYLFTFTYNYTRLIPSIEFNSVWFIHFWSLAVEEQFYLIWPLAVYFLSTKNLKGLLLSLFVLAPLFRYWFANYLLSKGYSNEMTGEITYAFTLSQFDAFAIGAAIPVFKLQEKLTKPGKWLILSLTVALAAGLLNYFILVKTNADFSITSLGISVAMIENLQHVWSYSLVNIVFMFTILYLIRENYTGLFNNGLLVSIGKIVFGIYIFHFAILFALTRLNSRFIHNQYLAFTLAFVITYALAYLSYTFYEKRFLGFKDFWKKRQA